MKTSIFIKKFKNSFLTPRLHNLLTGSALILISNGLVGTLLRESNTKIDRCAKYNLGLGLSSSSLLFILYLYKSWKN